MSALPGSVGFLPLQEYFGLLVSTFVYRNNKRHLRMKEHSRIEREKERRMKREQRSGREERILKLAGEIGPSSTQG